VGRAARSRCSRSKSTDSKASISLSGLKAWKSVPLVTERLTKYVVRSPVPLEEPGFFLVATIVRELCSECPEVRPTSRQLRTSDSKGHSQIDDSSVVLVKKFASRNDAN